MEDSPLIGSHMISDSCCFSEKKASDRELRLLFIYLGVELKNLYFANFSSYGFMKIVLWLQVKKKVDIFF